MVSPVQSFGLREMECAVLSKILSKMDHMDATIQAFGALRTTCKTLKAKIEDNECTLPFLLYRGVGTDKKSWQEAFKVSKAWFPLYTKWMETPLTIVAVDYSGSMDDTFDEDIRSHFSIAWEVLNDLYLAQQQSLRPEMVVYLFAEHCLKVDVNSDDQFMNLSNIINQNLGGFHRRDSALYSVFNELSMVGTSPLYQVSFSKKISIKVVSDQDFKEETVVTSVDILSSIAQRQEHRCRDFTIEIIPTSIGGQSTLTYRIALNQLNILKRTNIHVEHAIEPAAKRLRFDPPIPVFPNLLFEPIEFGD
jgi:hypothetical protein